MLDNNEDITARAVIRRHTQLKAASSITRSKDRAALLAHYQEKQAELRNWQKRVTKKSKDTMAKDLAERDMRIAELGGFTQWAKFFEEYQNIRNTIGELNAKQTKA